jgi:hypothetical protein
MITCKPLFQNHLRAFRIPALRTANRLAKRAHTELLASRRLNYMYAPNDGDSSASSIDYVKTSMR